MDDIKPIYRIRDYVIQVAYIDGLLLKLEKSFL